MTATETERDEMHRLAAYLRQNPAALSLTAEEIARNSGVTAESVRAIVSPRPAERRETRREATRIDLAGSISRFFDRSFANPIILVLVTLAVTILIMYAIDEPPRRTGPSPGITIEAAIQAAAVLFMMGIQWLCFYWRARARFAIYGAAIVGGVALAFTMVNLYVSGPLREQPIVGVMVAFGMGLVTAFYGFIGVGFASLGGYIRFRREETGLRRQSRQELLERLFEIEAALGRPIAPDRAPLLPFLPALRKNVFYWAIGAGFGSTFLMSLVSAMLPPTPTGPQTPPLVYALQLGFAFVSMVLQIGLAYLGGAPLRSVAVSLTFAAAAAASFLIPIGTVRNEWLKGALEPALFSVVVAILIGVFTGLGAYVEDRAYRARRRDANDPAVLLTEYVEIQRLLNPAARSQCVMVVDAAKSSTMKAHADPLVAEWSFRAYQEFIADIVQDCNGRIHSTAGDGAMAAFDEAECAFRAARTIQTKVGDFNAFVNRLNDPFRLRIGIHCGEVSGELDEVEFTAVLDIAAHVEAVSQIGGIAVTAPVASQLPDHRFAELPDPVDGYSVFVSMNPTLDPETA